MKNVVLFITFLLVGFVLTFFLIYKNTSQKVITPQVKISQEPSKFSLEDAPSTSLHGDITLLSGEVKWQSRTATESSIITLKQKVQQGESLETGKTGKVSVAFPGMLFQLSPTTKLTIIQALPTSMVVEQPSGEIEYQASSSAVLGIRTSPILLESHGGNFSVAIDDGDGTVTISVTSGGVTAAYNDNDNVSTVQKIGKDEVLTFDPSTRTSIIK